ncbi:MAG: ABC transporter permease [Ancrocorticia sp.]
MGMLNQFIGALVEAWGEVKVQKARVILSLVGVTAAVAAMSLVIAMGDLLEQAQREQMETWSGREVTLHVSAYQTGDAGPDGAMMSDGAAALDSGCVGPGCAVAVEDAAKADEKAESSQRRAEMEGLINDPVGNAMVTVANRFKIDYWSRLENAGDNPGVLSVKEFAEVQNQGTFKGQPVSGLSTDMGYMSLQYMAVDPDYRVIFRLNVLEGRWLKPGDVNQRLTPVVINSTLWNAFGKPDINGEPVLLTMEGKVKQQLRIVGVVDGGDQWNIQMYFPYDSWQLLKPADASMGGGASEMLVWVGRDQVEAARKMLPAAVSSVLGDGWSAEAYGGEEFFGGMGGEGGEDPFASTRVTIMAIGAIVIFLGALGLLNVAIVTVRQRIREIGIRRAMGASATRVFFAVFMESVVATFVAGVIGVGIAVIALRYIPLETFLYVTLQDQPPFPVTAAVAGVSIATAIGALCGIIPAFAAVRVKPIDAIRY